MGSLLSKIQTLLSEDKILHGPANMIHWTFPGAFLVVKPTQLDPFEKTFCQKMVEKTGLELDSSAITPNHNFGVLYCIDPLDLLDYFFKHVSAAIQL